MAVTTPNAVKLVQQNSIFRFSALGKFKNLIHGISRRRAPDISPLRELNLHPGAKVDAAHAARHRILLCNALKVDLDKTVWFDNVTPGPVRLVTRTDCGRGAGDWNTHFTGTSGLVTKETEVFPATLLNDNVVVLLFDPRWYVTGLVSVDPAQKNTEVIGEAVDMMAEELGCERKEIAALMTPSVGPCCFEFDDPSLPGMHNRTNLWDITRSALAHAGILRARIFNPRVCTACKPFDFYSVFAGGEGAGANAIIAGTSDAGNFGQALAKRRANAAVHRKPREARDASLKEISLSIEERRLNEQMRCPYGHNKVYIRSVLTGETEEMVEEPVISLRCAIIEHVGLAVGGYNIVDKDYVECYCCGQYQECEAYKRFQEKKRL